MEDNQKLYAFWRYDGFPTRQCLGAEVLSFGKNGLVKVAGYGHSFFSPFKICLYEEGILIQSRLDTLDALYNDELKKLKQKYSKLHDEILEVPPR